MYDPIKIVGLTEFRRELRKMDRELPKTLRKALNSASELVVETALPWVPRQTGRAALSLKARSTQTSARVAGGSARASYYPWLDFGGTVGRKKSVSRPFYKHGRYMYKAYDERRDEIEEILQRALVDLAREAGVGVTEVG
jgi:hypothetical protein